MVTLPESEQTSAKLTSSKRITRLRNIDWFCHVGSDSAAAETPTVERYLNKLGLSKFPVRYAKDTGDVFRCLTQHFDREWLDAEKRSYQRLIRQSGIDDAFDNQAVEYERLLTEIGLLTARQAAKHIVSEDAYLIKVAAGCAMETSYRYLRETQAGIESQGCFTAKLEIFALGRWPLCLSGESFVLY